MTATPVRRPRVLDVQGATMRIELPTLLTPGSHTLRLANLVSQAGALLDPNPTVRTFQTFRP